MFSAQQKPSDDVRWFEANTLSELLLAPANDALCSRLLEHVLSQRWFRGKARAVSELRVLDVLPLTAASSAQIELPLAAAKSEPAELVLAFVRVEYAASSGKRDLPEVYVLALARSASGPNPQNPRRAVLGLRTRETGESIVYDPSGTQELADSLLNLYRESLLTSVYGKLLITRSAALQERLSARSEPLHAHAPSADQSNTTLFFGQEIMLKLFRQLEDGVNPDVEICRFLWQHGYRNAPEPLGDLQYTGPEYHATLTAAQRYVPSQGTAWDVTNQALQQAFALALKKHAQGVSAVMPKGDLLASAKEALPDTISELLGSFAPLVRLLAQRTAELHLVLASDTTQPAFTPEPFTQPYQHALTQSARERLTRVYGLLRGQLPHLPAAIKPLAEQVLTLHGHLDHQLQALTDQVIKADRIRCHGDYHLGQVLYAPNDFVIIDFEGEPALSLAERRLPRSALYDVCGMLRSFHYAATVALHSDKVKPEERPLLAPWGEAFYRWCSALFLDAYLSRARSEPDKAVFLPGNDAQLRALLRLHMLDKCAYELGYELNNRPDWVLVPLSGLINLAQATIGSAP